MSTPAFSLQAESNLLLVDPGTCLFMGLQFTLEMGIKQMLVEVTKISSAL